MSDLIQLCEKWIDDKIITKKQIRIDGNDYNVFLETKTGLRIEFSVYIGRQTNEEEKAFLTLINNLIKHNVGSNLPF